MSAGKLPLHYRYQDELDGDGNVFVACVVYVPVAETPKGYWVLPECYCDWPLDYVPKKAKRFVLKDSRRRLCYPDKRQAFASYRVRKQRQIEHLKRQMRRATLALAATARIVTDEKAIDAIGDTGWMYGGDARLPAGNITEWWKAVLGGVES